MTKSKKCANCGESFKPSRTTQRVCSVRCGIEWTEKKKEEKERKEWNGRKSEIRENLKSLSDLKKELQILVNKIVRKIDEPFNCISCGKPSNKYDAGHFHSVKAKPELRFNLLNIWKQCAWNCNHHLSGNILNYENAIGEMYGTDFKDVLRLELPRRYKILRPDRETLREAIKTAKNELKTIEPARTKEERLAKRVEINEKLKLYID